MRIASRAATRRWSTARLVRTRPALSARVVFLFSVGRRDTDQLCDHWKRDRTRTGGGLFCDRASPSLANCVISGELSRIAGRRRLLHPGQPIVDQLHDKRELGEFWRRPFSCVGSSSSPDLHELHPLGRQPARDTPYDRQRHSHILRHSERVERFGQYRTPTRASLAPPPLASTGCGTA